MVEFICNQDRTKIYPCTAQSFFNAKTVEFNGVYVGESLYMDRHYLATFETVEQLYDELRVIHNRNDEIYGVSGYSDESFTLEEVHQRQL